MVTSTSTVPLPGEVSRGLQLTSGRKVGRGALKARACTAETVVIAPVCCTPRAATVLDRDHQMLKEVLRHLTSTSAAAEDLVLGLRVLGSIQEQPLSPGYRRRHEAGAKRKGDRELESGVLLPADQVEGLENGKI